jgi:hypothetical protein
MLSHTSMIQCRHTLTNGSCAVNTRPVLATSPCIRGARAMVTRNTSIDHAAFASAAQRFWSKVVCVDSASDTCWHWLAHKKNGYGTIKIGGRWFSAHRAAWILTYGDIDPTLTIDHLCRNRACVNPAHLEQVTMRVNTLRGMTFSGINSRKTHCPKGHPYSESNTKLTNKHARGTVVSRACRTCQNEQRRTERARAVQRARRSRHAS